MLMMMFIKVSLLVSLLLLLLVVVHVQSGPATDAVPSDNPIDPIAALRNMAELATADCYEDEENTLKIDIQPEGFEGLLTAQVPPNRNTKCIRYCIMRKNQLLNEAQYLDESAMLQFLAAAYINNNNSNNNNNDDNGSVSGDDGGGITEELLRRIISACKTQTTNETDRCERSHLVSTCIMAQLNESRVGA